MLEQLKFVQGSVAKKDFLPALTHFAIENGTVRGYNGKLALCCPIPFDIACKPKAEPLLAAIRKCKDTVQLSVTAAGRLAVRSGAFKAFVDCAEGETPHVLPTGQRVELDGACMLAALHAVERYVGNDASRPWSNGVLFAGQSAFATNNITLVEYWMQSAMPFVVNIPQAAVKELLRIDEAPTHAQHDESSVTFHYSGNRWLRTQLLQTNWPDLARVLNQPSTPKPIPPELFVGLENIKPFTDKLGRVYMRGGALHTHDETDAGASHAVEGLEAEGIYNVDMLQLLDGSAEAVDFGLYPKPCMFYGDHLRGAIVGLRGAIVGLRA